MSMRSLLLVRLHYDQDSAAGADVAGRGDAHGALGAGRCRLQVGWRFAEAVKVAQREGAAAAGRVVPGNGHLRARGVERGKDVPGPVVHQQLEAVVIDLSVAQSPANAGHALDAYQQVPDYGSSRPRGGRGAETQHLREV